MSWMLSCIGCGSKKLAEKEEAKVLDFQHYSLTAVPPYVFECERCLEELYLDCNQITELPRELFLCNELQILTLSDNDLHNIPSAISSLSNLTSLDISRNGISDIPDSIKSCKRLCTVNANTNPLCRLPEGFTQLVALRELSLSDTFLEYLPANFGRLIGLEVLELRENQLNTLPRSMTRLTALKRLDLGQNEFTELPEVVGHLTNLTDLWIDNNRIKLIPPEIGNLTRLSFIDASKNRLNEIDPAIGNCKSLSDLYFTRNELDELPASICRCTKLSTLHLDDNHLDRLPDDIGHLNCLVELKVSQNELSSLPGSVGLLRSLQFLHVDENLLTSLPGELGSCVSLIVITAAHNNISEMPAEMGSLPGLRVLNLCGNSIQDLPVSFTKLQLTALWLSENQAKPSVPLQCINNSSGHKVLTCFMLPQSLTQNSQSPTRADDDRPITEAEIEARLARSTIHFASDGDQKPPGRLTRVPTPYPKELRALAKHTKNILALKKEKERGGGGAVAAKEKKSAKKEPSEVCHTEEQPSTLITLKTSSVPVAVKVASTIASDSVIKSSPIQKVEEPPYPRTVTSPGSDVSTTKNAATDALCQNGVPTPPSSPPPAETPSPHKTVPQGVLHDGEVSLSPSKEKDTERIASFIVSRPPASLERDRKLSPPSVGLPLFKHQIKSSPVTPPSVASPTFASTASRSPTFASTVASRSAASPTFVSASIASQSAASPTVASASVVSRSGATPTFASPWSASSPVTTSTVTSPPSSESRGFSPSQNYPSDIPKGVSARAIEPLAPNIRPASIAVADITMTALAARGNYSQRPGSLALEGIMPPWQNQRPGSLAAPINTVGVPMPMQNKRAASQSALNSSSAAQNSPQHFGTGREDDYFSTGPKERSQEGLTSFTIRSNGNFLEEGSPERGIESPFDRTYVIEEYGEANESDSLLEKGEKNGLVSIIDQVTEEDIDEDTSLPLDLPEKRIEVQETASKIPAISPQHPYHFDVATHYNHSQMSPPSGDQCPKGLISSSGVAVVSRIPHVSTKVAQISSPKVVVSPTIKQTVPALSPLSGSRIPPPSYSSPVSPTGAKVTPEKPKSFIPKFDSSTKKETGPEIKKPKMERQSSIPQKQDPPSRTPTRDTPVRDVSSKDIPNLTQKSPSTRIPTFSSPTGTPEAKDQLHAVTNSGFVRLLSQTEKESLIPIKKMDSNSKQRSEPPMSPVEKPINQTGIPILSPNEGALEKTRIPTFSNSSLRGRKSAVPVASQKGLRYPAGGKYADASS